METEQAAEKKSHKMKLAATQGYVTRQFKFQKTEGVPQNDEEVIAIHRFATEPARVEVNLGLTLNLGNYESAKLTVGVTVPCYKEETEGAFVWAREWIEKKIQTEVDSIRHKKDTNIL